MMMNLGVIELGIGVELGLVMGLELGRGLRL